MTPANDSYVIDSQRPTAAIVLAGPPQAAAAAVVGHATRWVGAGFRSLLVDARPARQAIESQLEEVARSITRAATPSGDVDVVVAVDSAATASQLQQHVGEAARVVVGIGAAAAAVGMPTHEATSRLSPKARTVRVLVCDDDADMRTMLRTQLTTGSTLVVGEADDGRGAIELAGECDPDVVVLDLKMPVMSGEEALPLLRSAAPDAKVIVFTGCADEEVRSMTLQGAHLYLNKMRAWQLRDAVHLVATSASPEQGIVHVELEQGPDGGRAGTRRRPSVTGVARSPIA